jgi:hypothetical protein
MAENTTFHRMALRFESPWNIAGETTHNWSNKFAISGTIQLDAADAQATALDLAEPCLGIAHPHTSLVGYAYYPSGSTVATQTGEFTAGTHPGTAAAYSGSGGGIQQLEVCALARSLVGKSSRGKNVYLRKWIHDVQCAAGDPNSLDDSLDANHVLAAWNTGSGPHSVVPVDPTSGDVGAPWTFETHLYTHQLRRGAKRKATAFSSGDSTLDSLVKAVGTAAAVKALLELAPAIAG